MEHLRKFGYLNPAKNSSLEYMENHIPIEHSSNETTFRNMETSLEVVLKAFQQFNNLPITGELDDATKTFMAHPRCGIKDDMKSVRFNVPMPWRNEKITYTILNFTPHLSEDDVKKTLRKAFDIWSAVIPRNFEETSSPDADIKVSFESGPHGDAHHQIHWIFDGRGGELAHAGTAGILHFDMGEPWKVYEAGEVFSFGHKDLLEVSIHEIGHVLGLDHTSVRSSRMFANYKGSYDANHNYVIPELLSSDIVDIQEIYGPRKQLPKAPAKGTDGFWNQQTIGRLLKKHMAVENSDKSVITEAIFDDLEYKYGDKGYNFFVVIIYGHENRREQIQLRGDYIGHEENGMYAVAFRFASSSSNPECIFDETIHFTTAKFLANYILLECPQIKNLAVLGANGPDQLGWATTFRGGIVSSKSGDIGIWYGKPTTNAPTPEPKSTSPPETKETDDYWNQQTVGTLLKKHMAESSDRKVVKHAIYNDLKNKYGKTGYGFFIVIIYGHENRREQIQLSGDYIGYEANGMYAIVFRSQRSDSYLECILDETIHFTTAKILANYILQECPKIKSLVVLGDNGPSQLGWSTIYLGGFEYLKYGKIGIMYANPPSDAPRPITPAPEKKGTEDFWNQPTIGAILKKHMARSSDKKVVKEGIFDDLENKYEDKGYNFFVVIIYGHENLREQIQLRGDYVGHEENGMYAVAFRNRRFKTYHECNLDKKLEYSTAKSLADYILQECPEIKNLAVLGGSGPDQLGWATTYRGGIVASKSGDIGIWYGKPPQ